MAQFDHPNIGSDSDPIDQLKRSETLRRVPRAHRCADLDRVGVHASGFTGELSSEVGGAMAAVCRAYASSSFVKNRLGHISLVRIAIDVASGMLYLANAGFVVRAGLALLDIRSTEIWQLETF